MKLKLQTKYACVFGGLISLALLLNNAVDGYFSYRGTVEKVAEIQREKAGFAAQQAQKSLEDVSQLLIKSWKLASSGQSALEARIQVMEQLRENPVFSELILLDKDGLERYHVSRTDADAINSRKDRSDWPEFKKALTEGMYLSPTYFVNESEPHVKLSVAAGPDEARIVIASVSLEALLQDVSKTVVGKTGYAYAVDETGKLVAHRDLNLVLQGAKVASLPQVRAVVAALGGDEKSSAEPLGLDLAGNTVVSASYPIPKLGWRVFVEQPAKDALMPLFVDLAIHWGIMLVVGVSLALLVVNLMVRRLVTPITMLKQSAQAMTAGSLSQRIELRSGDELQDLGDQFNVMAERLAQSYANLEQKVQDRTQALHVANTELVEKELSLQEALVKSQQASAAKSAFLGMMTHELRTPLAGVVGMLDLTLKSLRHSADQSNYERVTEAQRNAYQLLDMLGGLLDIAEMDAGKLAVRSEVFALSDYLDDIRHRFAPKAQSKGLEFEIQVDASVPPFLMADERLMTTVLGNLIDNAIKFTRHGSVHVLVHCADPTGDVVPLKLEVVDTGLGIDPEAQKTMFEAFQQADTSSTRQFGGAGLGLAHARKLVDLMGGTIEVASAPGLGSKFTVALRVGVVHKTPHEYKLRILAAEDVLTNQIIVRDVVESMGHDIVLVENGREALEALAREHFNMVLMDLRMPVMDGIEATRWIRSGQHEGVHFVDPRLPIVALTANTSESDRERCIEAGMSGFLGKPLDELNLHQIISGVIADCLKSGVPLVPMRGAEPDADKPHDDDGLAALDDLLSLDAGPPNVVELPRVESSTPAPPEAEESRGDAKRKALQEKMLKVFREDAPKRIAVTETAIAAGDWETAAIVVHGIKGSAAYIWPGGEMYELSKNLEMWADDRQVDEFTTHFARLKELVAELADA
jgi:signal transduction histidine kinase/HPt (histidine-containing phosphotransfer) domain-containing protein